MQPVIEIKNLGKRYDITHQRGGYVALRDVLANVFKNPFSFLKSKAKRAVGLEKSEEFWALKDISFTIKSGEIIGVIGRNGAGKSTLLKILTGITPPTEGEAILHGKVSSLLEVGTGFHPELTGRENIFLNGAILGMSREEMGLKFNEIVTFAGIERFLDTPVKHYSSGMYVRLAFSVAAHLEPDILLIDEVLAVGDAEFQRKCLGKMEEVTRNEGRTILFISHNMAAIEQLCHKVIYLKDGHIEMFDETQKVISRYLDKGNPGTDSEWVNFENTQYQNFAFTLDRATLTAKDGSLIRSSVRREDDVYVRIEGHIREVDPALNFGYACYAEDGTLLYWSLLADQKEGLWPKLKPGRVSIASKVPTELLNEGAYRFEIIGGLHNREWICPPGNSPSITLTIQGGFKDSPYWIQKRPGALAPSFTWST